MYCVDVLRENLEPALDILADSVLNPLLSQEEVDEAKQVVTFQENEFPGDILSRDAAQLAAFKDQPLGNHHFCPVSLVDRVTPEALHKFRAKYMFGENCFLSGAGVDHESFVRMIDNKFVKPGKLHSAGKEAAARKQARIDGKKEKVLLRDFQMHAYRPQVLHLDFQRVNDKEDIHIHIPLQFINEDVSRAVKVQGAHITHIATEVEIRAKAADIPHSIIVDLKDISAGQTLHLSDLVLPKGVVLANLLRGEDAPVVVAAGIAEEVEAPEGSAVAISDIPAVDAKADKSAE